MSMLIIGGTFGLPPIEAPIEGGAIPIGIILPGGIVGIGTAVLENFPACCGGLPPGYLGTFIMGV